MSEIIVIMEVSSSYFSVARHYGGMKYNGRNYWYHPERDMLVRDDWDKFYKKMPWDDFIAAVKTGIKPKLPKKSAKAKKEEINNQERRN